MPLDSPILRSAAVSAFLFAIPATTATAQTNTPKKAGSPAVTNWVKQNFSTGCNVLSGSNRAIKAKRACVAEAIEMTKVIGREFIKYASTEMNLSADDLQSLTNAVDRDCNRRMRRLKLKNYPRYMDTPLFVSFGLGGVKRCLRTIQEQGKKHGVDYMPEARQIILNVANGIENGSINFRGGRFELPANTSEVAPKTERASERASAGTAIASCDESLSNAAEVQACIANTLQQTIEAQNIVDRALGRLEKTALAIGILGLSNAIGHSLLDPYNAERRITTITDFDRARVAYQRDFRSNCISAFQRNTNFNTGKANEDRDAIRAANSLGQRMVDCIDTMKKGVTTYGKGIFAKDFDVDLDHLANLRASAVKLRDLKGFTP